MSATEEERVLLLSRAIPRFFYWDSMYGKILRSVLADSERLAEVERAAADLRREANYEGNAPAARRAMSAVLTALYAVPGDTE